MFIVGIDVGINGGIAAMSGEAGVECIQATPMPIVEGTPKKGALRGTKSKIDIKGVLKWITEVRAAYVLHPGNPVVTLEIQHPMSKQGVTSMFHLGESYGMLEALPQVLGWSLLQVQPKQWKNAILCGTTKDKSAAIQWCLARYPTLDLNVGIRKVIHHDGMADAVCIAQYGWNEIMKSRRQDDHGTATNA